MEKIVLDKTVITLSEENNNVMVKSENDSAVIINQKIENLISLLEYNFDIVNTFYLNRILHSKTKMDRIDINNLSVSIVLFYLHMYNSWRNTYKNKANQLLKFEEKDFSNPSTADIIINFCKKKYPKDWKLSSSVLLGKTEAEFDHYYSEREKFYNK